MPSDQGPLMPERHPQRSFFTIDISALGLRDTIQQMEHPFYALSKKPDRAPRLYEYGASFIEFIPSAYGLPTIYDKDILVYCISYIVEAMRYGAYFSSRVKINTVDLLEFTNRGTSGRDYKEFSNAIVRLAGLRIRTNILAGKIETTEIFGLIDSATIEREHGRDGRLVSCAVTLSPWMMRAIETHEILTLHRDYFRLRKPLQRRAYELARKHCGAQSKWEIGIETMHAKSGAKTPLRRFRHEMKEMTEAFAESDAFPDYRISFDLGRDVLTFHSRGTVEAARIQPATFQPSLSSDVYTKARAAAPGWDVYLLEQQWRVWQARRKERPRNVDAAFLGFCKQRGRHPDC